MGTWLLIILIADILSSYSGAGPSCGCLSSRRTAHRYLVCFAAATAARNSASVLEGAVVD